MSAAEATSARSARRVWMPQLLSGYWITVCTSVAIYSVVALGLGILMGRTGLVSLGQIALLALAAWVAARLFFATGLPFPIVLLPGGPGTHAPVRKLVALRTTVIAPGCRPCG